MKSEKHYQQMIDAAFVGELSPAKWEELRAHLTTCADCRGRYDRATRFDRLLEGGPAKIGQPSSFELARVESAVFAQLDRETEPRWARWWSFRPMLGVAAALAAAIAVLAIVAPRAPDDEEFRARSGGETQRAAVVRAFCVRDGEVSKLSDTDNTCAISSNLKLAVGNGGRYRYTFLVGVQQDHRPLWYAPKPPAASSVEAPRAEEGEIAFGSAVKLDVNHQVGELRVFALFSDQPIAASEVQAAIEKTDRPIDQLEKLPISGEVAQRSVLVRVAP